MTYRASLFVGGPLDGEVRQVADVPFFYAPQLDVGAALWVPDDAGPPPSEPVRLRVLTYRRAKLAKGGWVLRHPTYILDSLTEQLEVDHAVQLAVAKAGMSQEDYYWEPGYPHA